MIRRDLIENARNERSRRSVENQLGRFMEMLNLQDDPEMYGWTQTGGAQVGIQAFQIQNVAILRRASFVSFYRDAHGRGIIRTLTKFIIGTGTLIDFFETDRGKKQKILKWWKKVQRSIKWFGFQREFVTRAFRDGEVFVWRMEPNGDNPVSRLRFIDSEDVEEINSDENDVENILSYKIKDIGDVDSAEIIHCKIMVDRNVKRGRPILEPILPLLAKYAKWLDARMVLSIVRTSVALVKQVTGPSTDLFRLRNAQTSNNRGNPNETDKSKMIRAGTVITGTPGVEYKMLSPNLDAKDAAEDGRTLLLASAASAGLPDAFITQDYQHVNFASMTVAQNPAIREFEDWQFYFGEYIFDIVAWLMEDGVKAGDIPQNADVDFDISFPPILRRDLAQETQSYQIMNQAGVISRRTWQLRAGLDPDEETDLITAEGGPTQPTTTANQGTQGAQDGKVSKPDASTRNPRQSVTGSGDSQVKEVEVTMLNGDGTSKRKNKRIKLQYSVHEDKNGALTDTNDGGDSEG